MSIDHGTKKFWLWGAELVLGASDGNIVLHDLALILVVNYALLRGSEDAHIFLMSQCSYLTVNTIVLVLETAVNNSTDSNKTAIQTASIL